MTQFIIRPELNGGITPDWDRLHEAMYQRQIYRVIKVNEIWRDLPTGTYLHQSTLDKNQVHTKCVAALNEIGKHNSSSKRDYELLVVKSDGTFSDLVVNTDKSKLPPNS